MESKRLTNTLKFVLVLCAVGCGNCAIARNFQFQLHKGESSSGGRSYYTNSTKRDTFKLTIGTAGSRDSDEEMMIKAATLLKDIRSKKMVINDIASLRFMPARGRQLFYITTGVANSSKDNYAYAGSDYSHGWIKGGVIIEIYQSGKLLKHWSSSTGPITKTQLSDSVKCARIDTHGYGGSSGFYGSSFDNATEIVADADNPKPESSETEAKEDGGELALSEFSMAMFRADASLSSMTRYGTLRISGDYYGPFSECAQTHWSVDINLECSDGNFSMQGYAQKSSAVGERLKDLLKDGVSHRVMVKISRGKGNYSPTRYVTVEDFCEDKSVAQAADDDVTELLASNYTFAMFRADASLASITFPVKAKLSDEYYGSFNDCQATHWSVEIMYSSGDNGWSSVRGYVVKDSSVGKRLLELIKDGGAHPMLMRVARSESGPMGTRYVTIKDFKVLDANDPSVSNIGPSFSGFSGPSYPAIRRTRVIRRSSGGGVQSAPKVDTEELIRVENEHEQEMIRRRSSETR